MKFQIEKEDLRLCLLGCFRYSLGRMTYMPGFISRLIQSNKEIFDSNDWQRFIDEIEQKENLGMECDRLMWNGFRDFCITQDKHDALYTKSEESK